MTNVCKVSSRVDRALQEVEAVLEQHGMEIAIGFGGLVVRMGGVSYQLEDIENGGYCTLPRALDTERLVYR